MAKEKENKVKNDNNRFMKDVKGELKKVSWPTSKQMVSNVSAVITIVLVTAVIVFCLDFIFSAVNKYGVEKIKEQLQSKNQSQTQIVDNTNNEQSNEVNQESNDGNNNVNLTENTVTTENEGNTESTENGENTVGAQNN